MVLNGSHSDYSSIESGVPQGSVLSPLLFLVYINDLERNIKSNIKLFADGNMLFSVVKNPEISANDQNHDLDGMRQWSHQKKIELIPDPTKQTTKALFSWKNYSPNHPQIMFDGTVVAKINDQKHLGIILDSSLSFKKHLIEKIMQAENKLGIIKHLFIFLSHKTLDLMYKVLVRSHLVFCDIIHHIPSRQTRAGVTLYGKWKKLKEFNTKQLLLSLVHGKVHVAQSPMRN